MKERLMCSRFYCDKMKERICCRSCFWVDRCSNPCHNTPDRCGLAEKKEETYVNQNRERVY
ncbi:MAG: hypothetical protein Q4E45_02310 [Eubacteriales bacterium]|nr:hypothetical protein [Eubacteriales bacterium]